MKNGIMPWELQQARSDAMNDTVKGRCCKVRHIFMLRLHSDARFTRSVSPGHAEAVAVLDQNFDPAQFLAAAAKAWGLSSRLWSIWILLFWHPLAFFGISWLLEFSVGIDEFNVTCMENGVKNFSTCIWSNEPGRSAELGLYFHHFSLVFIRQYWNTMNIYELFIHPINRCVCVCELVWWTSHFALRSFRLEEELNSTGAYPSPFGCSTGTGKITRNPVIADHAGFDR